MTAATIEMTTGTSLESQTPQPRTNTLVWFELPVSDLTRAKHFYERVFSTRLKIDEHFPNLAIFPRTAEEAATGALVQGGPESVLGASPSTDGTVIYLNCDGDLDGVLHRAQSLGATVLQEVAQLPGRMGWIAQFRDLDGNRVGLHAIF
jgi:uncharacterized protein